MPSQAKKDEIIDIKVIVQHDMESGFRRDEQGGIIARDILRTFSCKYNGAEIFRADLHPGTGANPMIVFSTVATETGTLEFTWAGDNDYLAKTTSQLTVT
jgi:sulfur-oxidizing protein SoxZ